MKNARTLGAKLRESFYQKNIVENRTRVSPVADKLDRNQKLQSTLKKRKKNCVKCFSLVLLHAHFQLFERPFQCQAYGRNFRGLFSSFPRVRERTITVDRENYKVLDTDD